MGDSGVVGLRRQNAIHDLSGLLLADVSFVGGRRGSDQRERKENGGLAVFRITRRKLLHGVAPGEGTLAGHFIRIFVRSLDCRDVVVLALRFSYR